MKTVKDLRSLYNAKINNEIANLERMCEEYTANMNVAESIVNDLEPILSKLHLTVEEVNVNQPNKVVASHSGRISLRLVSDGKFKFIKFAGYTSRGAGKNESRLNSKAEKMVITVDNALSHSYENFNCYVNMYSLEVKDESEQGVVLMSISYTF